MRMIGYGSVGLDLDLDEIKYKTWPSKRTKRTTDKAG